MQPANDPGVTHITRLDPNTVDIVLGSPRSARRTPAAKHTPWRRWGVLLALGLGAAWYFNKSATPASAPAMPSVAPAPDTVMARPEPEIAASVPAHTFVPIETRTLDQAPAATPPVPSNTPRTGLVSQAYLDKYHASRQPPVRSRPYQVASVAFPSFNGTRFHTQWKIYDGVIDGGSVCTNFAENTGERMDCRSAAQLFFRDECKQWSRRAEKNRDEVTRATRQQYCTASTAFVP